MQTQDCVVADAVGLEPVSLPANPANAGWLCQNAGSALCGSGQKRL